MRFARVADAGEVRLVVAEDGVGAAPVVEVLGGDPDPDLVAILADEAVLDQLRGALPRLAEPAWTWPEDTRTRVPLPALRRVFCIGLNYRDHVEEVGLEVPTAPLLFGRWAESVTGPFDDVPVPAHVERFDYEVELGVLVGRSGRDLTADQAADAIVGYTVANDLSARDLQFADGQWTRGKNLDGSCPLGPVVVAAGVLDVTDLEIRCAVNGETRQSSSTRQMVFSPAQILAHLSRTMELRPGDLVITGTPPGVAMGSDDIPWLVNGDVVRCEVAGIGAIENRVRVAGARG